MLKELKDKFEKIYKECEAKTKDENAVQLFMEDNTQLIPRVFLLNHGVNLKTVFIKVGIGDVYKSDFMLITKSTAQWRCIHIEIENPIRKPFTKNGELTSDFTHAIGQVNSWKSVLAEPIQQLAFSEKIKKTFAINMRDNPIDHKFVLVFGRRDDLILDKNKQWLSLSNDSVKVMTFDSLFENDENRDKKLHLAKFVENSVRIETMNGVFDGASFAEFLNPADFQFKKSDVDKMIEERKKMQENTDEFYKKASEDYENKIIRKLSQIPTYA